MALTKTEALDKFCEALNYPTSKLPNESKVEFLARKQKEWALLIVKNKLASEEVAGVDL